MKARRTDDTGQPAWSCVLPVDTVAMVEAIAEQEGLTPEEIASGRGGYTLVPLPNIAAQRVIDVELAAGLPAGTIVRRIFCDLCDEWTQGEQTAVLRWLRKHFVFEGDLAEYARMATALIKLEKEWRRLKHEAEFPKMF